MNPFHLPAQVSRGYLAGPAGNVPLLSTISKSALEKGEKKI